MRLISGEKAPYIELPSIDGSTFSTKELDGKPYLLSFYRFAGCPFCNLRVHQLVQNYSDHYNFVIVFDSPIEDLIYHTKKHEAPFPILADKENTYYKAFGIEKSLAGMFKGMIFRFPTLMKSMLKGFVPTTIKGSMTTMPA